MSHLNKILYVPGVLAFFFTSPGSFAGRWCNGGFCIRCPYCIQQVESTLFENRCSGHLNQSDSLRVEWSRTINTYSTLMIFFKYYFQYGTDAHKTNSGQTISKLFQFSCLIFPSFSARSFWHYDHLFQWWPRKKRPEFWNLFEVPKEGQVMIEIDSS